MRFWWSLIDGFDYSTLDLTAARGALQTLARAAIDQALAPGAVGSMEWNALGALETFVLPLTLLNNRRRLSEHEIKRSLRLTEAPKKLNDFDVAVGDIIRPRRFTSQLFDCLASPFQIQGSGAVGADRVLQSVVLAAWSDARFRVGVTQKFRSALMSRVLFYPATSPIVILHPNTYWLLVASLNFRIVGAPSRRRTARFLRALQDQATVSIASGNWAGFWEQWILTEMIRGHGWSIPNKVEHAIKGLPITRMPAYQSLHGGVPDGKTDTQEADADLGIASDTWHESVPEWFSQLDHSYP